MKKIKGAKNMKTIQELEQEYNEVKVKVLKASNDFANEINKWSPALDPAILFLNLYSKGHSLQQLKEEGKLQKWILIVKE